MNSCQLGSMAQMDSDKNATSRWYLPPLAIALLYFLLATLWILFSDWLVALTQVNVSGVTRFQEIKGMGFVLVTAALLYYLIQRYKAALEVQARGREAATAKLQQRTGLLQSVLDSMSDGVIVVENSAPYVLLNPVAEKILGAAPAGQDLPDWLHSCGFLLPGSFSQCKEEDLPLTRALRGEAVDDIELCMCQIQDRHCKWLRMSARPLQSDSAGIHGAVAIVEDITQARQAEEALRESQRTLSTLMSNLPGMAYRCRNDRDWTLEFVSEGCVSLTGYQPAHFLDGRVQYNDVIHPDDRQSVWDQVQQALAEGRPFTLTYRLRTADGQEKWVWEQGEAVGTDAAGFQMLEGFVTDITEKRRAEEQLEESEEHFRTLIENAQDIIAVFEADGAVRYVSPSVKRILEYEPEELMGRQGLDMVHPDDLDSASMALDQAMARPGSTANVVFRYRHKNGSWRYFEGLGKVIIDAFGNRVVVLNSRDVTDRVLAEARLSRNEGHFRSLIENASDLILVADQRCYLRYVSPSIERLLGYRPEDWQGRPSFDFVHPDDAGRVQNALRDVVQSPDATITFDVRLCHCDGGWRFFEGICRSILDPSGELVTVVNARDISERKRTEDENRRLAAAVQQTDETILISDPDGTIEYVNPAFERASGYSREEVIGKNPRILQSDQHSKRFYSQLWEKITRGDVWNGIIVNRRKDGSLYRERGTISPLFDDSGRIVNYVSVRHDVTDELRIEAQMREHQKLEAIGTLAGGISHDFNNILSAVLGYAEIALQELPPDSPVRGDLEEIMNAGQRARDLIHQILMFSRQTEQEKQPLRLDLILKEALKMIFASLPATIEIRETYDPHCGSVLADASQMHQVIMNLCTNAYHAMREKGGILAVGLEPVALEEDDASAFSELEPGNYVRLTVSDTGHGMDDDTVARIFEPFFTTKKDEGTGLGLATVHGIVKSHGGAITVYSEVGQGTTFHVYFPRIERHEKHEVSMDEHIPHGNGEHILLVDDEETLTRVGRQMLERLGYVVTVRTNGIEALEAFRAQPQRYDVIVSDQTMPHLTGMELTARAKAIRSDVPVILTTGFSETITDQRTAALGISSVVMKPILSRNLAHAVHRALRNGGNGSTDRSSD